jgi:hypothetical protein
MKVDAFVACFAVCFQANVPCSVAIDSHYHPGYA